MVSQQLSLLDAIPNPNKMSKLEKDFWKFHEKHPEVFEVLVRFAYEWREHKGPDAKIGLSALYERARWEITFESLSNQKPPKLSNNHRAFYARLITETHKDLMGIFQLKKQSIQASFGPSNTSLPASDHIITS